VRRHLNQIITIITLQSRHIFVLSFNIIALSIKKSVTQCNNINLSHREIRLSICPKVQYDYPYPRSRSLDSATKGKHALHTGHSHVSKCLPDRQCFKCPNKRKSEELGLSYRMNLQNYQLCCNHSQVYAAVQEVALPGNTTTYVRSPTHL
jgi:hypothetical protein